MAIGDRPGKGNPRPDTRPKGYTFLPGGPAFQSREKMAEWMAKNPGWVYKHRSWVKSQAPRAAAIAGFIINGDEVRQYKYDGGKGRVRDSELLRLWTSEASPKGVAQMNRNRDIKAEVFVRGQKVTDKEGRFVPPKANAKSAAGPGPKGPKPQGSGAAGATGDVAPSNAVIDFSTLLAGVNSPETQVVPTAWANGGARLLDPKMAEQLAGIQFDGQIADLEAQQGVNTRQTAQNDTDIRNWFGQVLGSQATAVQRDKAATAAGVESVQGAGQALLSAIGGQAAGGAGTVAAAGQNAVGTLQALGTAQEQFNNDLRPLLEAEAAGARTREQAAGSQRAHELAQRISTLRGDRGRAQTGFQFEIDQANNQIRDNRQSRAIDIRNQNNAIAQQNFQNALALAQAQMGAAMTGLEFEQGVAELNGAGAGKETSFPWGKAPVSQKNAAYNQAVSAIFDGERLRMNVPQAVRTVNQIINGFGWSRKNPAVMALRNQILQDAGIRPDPRWR